jgi:hypothetical protein
MIRWMWFMGSQQKPVEQKCSFNFRSLIPKLKLHGGTGIIKAFIT